jgi:hypothetical protein
MSSNPVLGLFMGTVANNTDPLQQTRVTLYIPQILGTAESAWAVPSSPTNRVPEIGQVLWVQFSGGDITKPVYSPLGLLEIDASQIKAGGITADRIDATNLHVAAANVDGLLEAGQIDADSLHVKAANITGLLQAAQLSATAVDGKTVTGATLQTALSGRRIVLAPDGNLYFYTGSAIEFAPGRVQPNGADTSLAMYGPKTDDILDYGITLKLSGTDTSATIDTDLTTVSGDLNLLGTLRAGNVASGRITITPVPNTPTSLVVSGLAMTTGNMRVMLTLVSQVPGTIVQGIGTSDVSPDGFTAWVTRTNNTPTQIDWFAWGV